MVILYEKHARCPDCNGKLRYLPDEVYCTKCGLVIDDSPIDTDSETADCIGEESNNNKRPMNYMAGYGKKKLPPTVIGKK